MANMSWSKVTGAKRNAATRKAGHTPRFFLRDFHGAAPEYTFKREANRHDKAQTIH
jgi:hypothetical protein